MNNIIKFDEIKDKQAEHRDKKRRPRMRQHGRALKKQSARSALHIAKVENKQKR